MHPDNGILFSAKIKWPIKSQRHGGNLNIPKWKKPLGKGYILYGFNYMIFWKRQNFGDNKKRLMVASVSREEDEEAERKEY